MIIKRPKLNKLGGIEWGKTTSKVKTAVWQVANDLVELYALRQSKEGSLILIVKKEKRGSAALFECCLDSEYRDNGSGL